MRTGKFELKKANSDLYHFNLLAGNGQIVLQSEMYTSKASAINGINSVKTNSQIDERYIIATSLSGKYYFQIKAGNHQVIAQSQHYESEAGRANGIAAVKRCAPDANIDDITHFPHNGGW